MTMERSPIFAPYVNARIRGMKSTLLSAARISDLLENGSESIMIEVLLNSDYAKELAEALAKKKGADAIEEALSRHLVCTLRELLSLVSVAFEKLPELYLLRWDLACAKSLMRNRHLDVSESATISAVLPGPTLSVAVVEELTKLNSMESLLAALAGWCPWLCSCLPGKLNEYLESGDLTPLEDALDRRYYAQTVSELEDERDEDSAIMRRLLQMEIDRINIRILFETLTLRKPPQEILQRILRGGTLSILKLQKIAGSQSVVTATELLGSTPYKGIVEGLYPFIQTGRSSSLDRIVEMAVYKQLKRMAIQSSLSIAVFMHFAWLKANEVTNLRLIARGYNRQVPHARVREALLHA